MPTMQKAAELTKPTVRAIFGFATGAVVNTIIRNNTNPETRFQKATIATGSYAIGAMTADRARAWSDAKIDKFVVRWYEQKAVHEASKDTTDK